MATYIYKPLPAEHEKAPAWQRVYQPDGVDPARLCLKRGWLLDPPAEFDIYNADGTLFQAAEKGLALAEEDEAAAPPTPKRRGRPRKEETS